tara:strand:+ start:874 stop:1044 length:171 start_codon:yes stop_codon:yes gene_type:complete
MATKSILKDIDIREKNLGRSLVHALENAEHATGKVVKYSRSFKEIKKDQIKKLFGD